MIILVVPLLNTLRRRPVRGQMTNRNTSALNLLNMVRRKNEEKEITHEKNSFGTRLDRHRGSIVCSGRG
jgi:hypothetical protein